MKKHALNNKKTMTNIKNNFKEWYLRLLTFETFVHSDDEIRPVKDNGKDKANDNGNNNNKGNPM